jgi:FMN phosphatase YigB (HAD superfamily)
MMIRPAHRGDVQMMHCPPRQVLAVLFDLDNTLAERDHAFLAWANWLAQERLDLKQEQAIVEAITALVALDADGHRPKEEMFSTLKARFAFSLEKQLLGVA